MISSIYCMWVKLTELDDMRIGCVIKCSLTGASSIHIFHHNLVVIVVYVTTHASSHMMHYLNTSSTVLLINIIINEQVVMEILIFLCFISADISEFDALLLLLLLLQQVEMHLCLHVYHWVGIHIIHELFYWFSEQRILRGFVSTIHTQKRIIR